MLLPMLLAGAIWFSVSVPFSSAPLNLDAYVRLAEYPPGTIMNGVVWNEHFTDLRVTATNSTADDYHNLDILIAPDNWTHTANFIGPLSGCDLYPMTQTVMKATVFTKSGTDKVITIRSGGSVDTYDTQGNIYTTVAFQPGYRVRCSTLPSHHTIVIAFVIVDVPSSIYPPDKRPPGANSVYMTDAGKVVSVFDTLGPKPSPEHVRLNGGYISGIKPFSLTNTISVTKAIK